MGKVTDESGGAMPGVTITVKSPQLQVPQINAVTGADGDYRMLELPRGTYSISFELSGFQTQLRTDVNLTVGLAGKVDVVMKIGALEETVQVSGQSPVVDTVNVTGQTTLVQDQLRTIPMGGTMQEMLPLAAGVSTQNKPDVGDSNLADRSAIVTYGVVLQPTLDVEGINTVTDHAANTAVYLNSFSLEEVQFKTSGNNAEIAFPGLAQVAVLKSGSNEFHGSVRGSYENPNWQGNNITPELAAQGLRQTNPIVDPGYYEDIFDLGGRIIRDKLWFYGSYSKQAVTQGQVGFVARAQRRRLLAGHVRWHDAGHRPHRSPRLQREGVVSAQLHDQADRVEDVRDQASVGQRRQPDDPAALDALPAPAAERLEGRSAERSEPEAPLQRDLRLRRLPRELHCAARPQHHRIPQWHGREGQPEQPGAE